jgi:hypothetical protein
MRNGRNYFVREEMNEKKMLAERARDSLIDWIDEQRVEKTRIT